MSWNPTSWDALPQSLKDMFHEIIYWNDVLQEAVNQIKMKSKMNAQMNAQSFYTHCKSKGITEDETFIKTCWDFVIYQYAEVCSCSYKIFEEEGFHIGSPWHGDILQAPVLFLSINPGVTHKCFFPRWNWKHKTYAFGGEQNGFMNYSITYRNDNGADISVNNVIHNEREIYDFLTNRFMMTCLDNRGAGSKNIWYPNAWIIRSGNTCTGKNGNDKGGRRGVPYWQGIRNTMEHLLEIASCSQNTDARIAKDITRRLMRPVLSAEIFSWGSQAGSGTKDKERQKYFWDRFVVPMLENSAARIIFLVGKDTQNAFRRRVQTKKPCNRFGEELFEVNVNHFSQGPQNYSVEVDSLLAQENNNQVIHNALQEARRIYNQ